MEITTTRFTIKGRWDGDRNGSGVMVTKDVNIPVSAPAEFDGPGIGSNPEELLVASAATCYIITLASLLSRKGIKYSHLDISSVGITEEKGNKLTFKAIIHRPVIVIKDRDEELKKEAERIARQAEKACFIGQTLKPGVAISVEPDVKFV